MPLQPSMLEERGPSVGHFALLMDTSGTRLAIRPGSSLWLVEDKSDASKIYPMVLKKVTHKKLTFELVQADGAVMEYTYQLTTAKPKSKAALEKLLQNRGDAPVKYQR